MKTKTPKSPKLVANATAVAPLNVRPAEELEPQHRVGRAPLDHDERGAGARGDDEQERHPPRAVADVLALDHREGERS